MRAAIVSTLLLASATDAFAPTPATKASSTALNHIDTRHNIPGQELGIWPQSCQDKHGNYVPCDAISGHERRASWQTYAPPHGTPTQVGAIGCPGGGDWCYANSFDGASPIPDNDNRVMKKRAATVAAALAGLGRGVGGAASVARTFGTAAAGMGSDGGGAGGGSLPALPSATASGGGGGSSVSGEDLEVDRCRHFRRQLRRQRTATRCRGRISARGGRALLPSMFTVVVSARWVKLDLAAAYHRRLDRTRRVCCRLRVVLQRVVLRRGWVRQVVLRRTVLVAGNPNPKGL